jgi:hypothetical protein
MTRPVGSRLKGSVKRAELLDDIVAARPEAGELIYIERRGEDYRWTRTNPGDTVDMPETGGFPDAWMYYSGRWPLDDPEKLPVFFEDLLAELESMTGAAPDRCRWSPDDPWPHSH